MADRFFVIAQITGAFALLANVVGIQSKKKVQILKAFVGAGLLFAVSFIFLGAYAGAVACFIASIQTIVNYIFTSKKKKFPVSLIAVFIIVSVISGVVVYQNIYDVLPILTGAVFVLIIVQERESRIRKLTLLNLLLWITYDFLIGAYVASASDLAFIISTVVAIVRLDFIKQKPNETDDNIPT